MSSEWGQVKLGDLVEIKHGFAFKGEFFCEAPTPYQLTTPGNFAIGGGFQSGKGKFYQGPVPEEYVLNAGDLVVTMTDLSKAADTLGYSAVVPETPGTTWLHNQRVGLVSIKPGALVSYGFVHYLMRSPEYRHWVVSTATGSTVKHTSPGRICDYEFLLPPQDYQQHVSGILGDLDTRITFLRETNATLEAIAQALFKSWFVDFNPVLAKMEGRSPEGMDEATAALFPDAFEESELGLVPRGWRVGAFSDVCDIASGKRPPDRSDSAEVGNETPLYGGAGIMGYTSMPLFDDRKILTGRVGTLGKVHIAYPPFWASDNVLVITPKDQSCFSLVLHWLRTIDVLALNRGSTQPLLTQRDLGAQRGVIPPSHVVAEFEEVVEPLYQRIQEQEVQVQTLASLRDNLLPRLISGQLSLLDAESTISEAQV